MPLLGRHKSPGGSSSSSNSNSPVSPAPGQPQRRPQQPLCESPLFGVRRQLPLGDSHATSTNSKQQPGGGSPMGAHHSDSEPLSSVPQQITRQQINYAFAIMDTNKDGMIDLRDLSQMLANLGVPIDEAILSHIMSSVSKRGDHRISEAEFLDWIGRFIQVSDAPAAGSRQPGEGAEQQARSGRRRRLPGLSGASASSKGRSPASASGSSSSLVAQPTDALPRNRRGSGSGLALMRSLSGDRSAGRAAEAPEGSPEPSRQKQAANKQQQQPNSSQQQQADLEARNDLRAAFGVFDLDGDGFITIDEVRAGLRLLGESWSPGELQHLFSKCSGGSRRGASGGGDPSNQRISIDDFVQLLL